MPERSGSISGSRWLFYRPADRDITYLCSAPQNASLWRDEVKTLFDPCPAGWRVPRSGAQELSPWSFFCVEQAAAGTPNATAPDFEEGAAAGFHFFSDPAHSATCWYPATGSRFGSTSEIVEAGRYGYWRSSTISPTKTAYFLTIVPTTVFPFDDAISTASRASALTVRCVRE